MKYKKGLVINNTCWVCGNSQMTIYRLSRNKNSKDVFIWCKCEKCGAVDDIMEEEN